MKKSMMVLAVSVIGLVAKAQNTSFGINGGFGNTWINESKSTFRPFGNLGFSLIYSSKSRFGIGADLKYSLEGGNAENGAVKNNTGLNYVRLPLKAMYFFGNTGQRVRPKVTIGPSFGFLTGGKIKVTTSPSQETIVKAKDLYKTTDIGLNASAGIHYRLMKNTWLAADVSYYKGLTNNIKNTGFGTLLFTAPYHNNNIALNIGINWGI